MEILNLWGWCFFSKYSKFNVDCKNAIKNWEKVLVFQIIAFQLVAVNSPYYYENTHSWQSMCIKGLVSENASAVEGFTSPKNCCNLQKITFRLLFYRSEPNWVRRSHFWSDLRFQNCLLTRWLRTTSILVVIGRIYRCQFKYNYLKNQKLFLNFLLHFCNLH